MKHLTLTRILLLSFIAVFFNGCSTFQPLKECRAMCQGQVEVYQSDSEKCVCRGKDE